MGVLHKLIESAQTRWRAVNAPHLVALVRTSATLQRRQTNQVANNKPHDMPEASDHRDPVTIDPADPPRHSRLNSPRKGTLRCGEFTAAKGRNLKPGANLWLA
jgi:hypothetical protein